VESDEAIVLDTPEDIEFFQLLSIRGRLKIEMKGIRFKQGMRSTSAAARAMGFKGRSRKELVEAMTVEIERRIAERQQRP